MTLREFCKKADIVSGMANDQGAFCIALSRELSYEEGWELFHLDDYAVSTVSGPVYWLVPRNKEPQCEKKS